MSENKRKGRRVATRRFLEDDDLFVEESKTLDDLFAIFIKAKELEELRERTLQDHRYNYRYFKEYLNENYPHISLGAEVTVDMIRDYIYYLKKEKGIWDNHEVLAEKYGHKKGLSPVTINVRLRSIKTFFKFCKDEGHLKQNPTEKVKLLKTEEDTIEAFSSEQINLLLEQPDQRTFVGFRDYVLMVVMLDTGIRVGEAVQLKEEHFNFEQKILKVPASIAKNKKYRELPLSKKTAKLLKTLTKENNMIINHMDHLFLTNYGESIDPSNIRSRFTEYGKKAKIKGIRVSPHTFRHTFAKFYILNGGDPFTLQRILDHSTMNMVRKYIQMNNEDIKLQHNQFSPISIILS